MDIWAPPGSWYNSGSDVKWCWEGALEFQRPVSPSLPLWTFTSQVTCPLRERETLAPLKGTGGPSMLQPGGESSECLWELGEGARKSKYICAGGAGSRHWVDGPLWIGIWV